MENTKNRNSGSNNEPEYGSRHSRNRSADASGNSVHGARGAAGTRARKVPHGVESDGWIPAQRHPHAASATRKSGGDKTDVTFSVRSEFFFLSHCLGFAAIQPTALPALTRSLFPEAGNTVPNR